METVGEVLTKRQQSGCEMITTKPSVGYLQSTTATKAFLTRYSPAIKEQVAADRISAVAETTKNPRLQDVINVYGAAAAADWLEVQLSHTFSLCGFDFLLGSDATVIHIGKVIAAEYNYLRLGELALFLLDFGQGKFGDHQTRFNEQKFFTALREFLKVRADLRERKMQEDKEKARAEAAKRAVPPPENLQHLQSILNKINSEK